MNGDAGWLVFRNHWQRNAGRRLDHLLLSPKLTPLLLDAGVDRFPRRLSRIMLTREDRKTGILEPLQLGSRFGP